MTGTFSTIPDIIASLRRGEMVIMLDDEGRENEGDFVMMADHITAKKLMFMVRHGCGSIWLTIDSATRRRLGLVPMVAENDSRFGTAFTVSFEAREGTTTGISAQERAHSILTALQPDATSSDIVTPGHIFPIEARDGGVMVRNGHTEASVDLARMAGGTPAGIISEIMNEDGTMARLPQLQVIARRHGLLMGTIADLMIYRKTHEHNFSKQEASFA